MVVEEAEEAPILDLLPELLLLHILRFLEDGQSWHWAALALQGDPRSLAFLLLPPAFCFPALERLDVSLISPWGHPLLSSVSLAAGAPLSSSGYHPHHPEEIAEQNTIITARLAHAFPAVESLSVYCLYAAADLEVVLVWPY